MTQYKSFETERLLIKPTSIDDSEFLFELMNSPKWLQFIGDRNIKNIEDAKLYIEHKMTPQLERLGYSNYTVIRKSDKVKLGTCGLYDRENLEGVDIGFAFLPQYEKQGYGFESVMKLKDVALEIFHIKKLSGITEKENIPSQKLLKKLGLTFSKMIHFPDEEEELLLYTIDLDQ